MITVPLHDLDVPHMPQTPSADSGSSDPELLQRFASHQDADAFELLVRRHGPMVLSVCRRMLRDTHAADDAFQATFLVLVRKASAIREPALLGNWLYGVAYHTAFRARIQSAQRVDHELRTPSMPKNDDPNEIERRELRCVLDEELNHLPRTYRDPLVLCYLQGKTHAEAARLLGCPVGSISGRLATAREKLRARLRRRGLSTSAGLFGALLLASAARSEVPAPLIRASVQAAVGAAAGEKAVVGLSPRVVDLAQFALRGMQVGVIKVVVAFLLAMLSVSCATVQLVSLAAADDAGSKTVVARQIHADAGGGLAVFGSQTADEQAGAEAVIEQVRGRCGH